MTDIRRASGGPSKLRISVSSIEEFDLSDGKAKQLSTASGAKRKKSDNHLGKRKPSDGQAEVEGKVPPKKDASRNPSISTLKKNDAAYSKPVKESSITKQNAQVRTSALNASQAGRKSSSRTSVRRGTVAGQDPDTRDVTFSPNPRLSNASKSATEPGAGGRQRRESGAGGEPAPPGPDGARAGRASVGGAEQGRASLSAPEQSGARKASDGGAAAKERRRSDSFSLGDDLGPVFARQTEQHLILSVWREAIDEKKPLGVEDEPAGRGARGPRGGPPPGATPSASGWTASGADVRSPQDPGDPGARQNKRKSVFIKSSPSAAKAGSERERGKSISDKEGRKSVAEKDGRKSIIERERSKSILEREKSKSVTGKLKDVAGAFSMDSSKDLRGKRKESHWDNEKKGDKKANKSGEMHHKTSHEDKKSKEKEESTGDKTAKPKHKESSQSERNKHHATDDALVLSAVNATEDKSAMKSSATDTANENYLPSEKATRGIDKTFDYTLEQTDDTETEEGSKISTKKRIQEGDRLENKDGWKHQGGKEHYLNEQSVSEQGKKQWDLKEQSQTEQSRRQWDLKEESKTEYDKKEWNLTERDETKQGGKDWHLKEQAETERKRQALKGKEGERKAQVEKAEDEKGQEAGKTNIFESGRFEQMMAELAAAAQQRRGPPSIKERVLKTLTARQIALLIPQDPQWVSPHERPISIVLPARSALQDREAGRSAGADGRSIPEEFFASPQAYRESIDATKRRLRAPGERAARQRAGRTVAVGTDDELEPLPSFARSSTQDGLTSSEDDMVGSDGRLRPPRSGRFPGERGSAERRMWKRQESVRAYKQYQRETDPRYRYIDDGVSNSTLASVYPASNSSGSRGRSSDVSSEVEEDSSQDLTPENCVTRGTSTSALGRTEGTQTTQGEYLLLDRRSCLVKVLAALQRLNTDDAIQVARILRRSIEESSSGRLYESIDSQQPLVDASGPPPIRTESEKTLPETEGDVIPEDVTDEDYDEMTRIVSQFELLIRSKLRITAAPYSLIYESLINCHLEITQDCSPSVAVFNYYLTEQGHPLFEDVRAFSRPTILQQRRESLYPRLYARPAFGEPRQLPANCRLLDLQLLASELLVCPFCGRDVLWGQQSMCVEFCCDALAELVEREYEDDLGEIRRQAALRRRLTELGQLGLGQELLAAALTAAGADELQPPVKSSCRLGKLSRQSIEKYGQEGRAMSPAKKEAVAKKKEKARKKADKKRKKQQDARRKSLEHERKRRSGESQRGKRERRRSASQKRERKERQKQQRKKPAPAASRGLGPARSRRSAGDVDEPDRERLERRLGRRLTQEEEMELLDGGDVEQLLERRARRRTGPDSADSLDLLDSRIELMITTGEDRPADSATGLGSTESGDETDADVDVEADDEASTATGRPRKRSAKRRRKAKESVQEMESFSRSRRDALVEEDDDQLHYRLSEAAFLEEGLTQLPEGGYDEQELLNNMTDLTPELEEVTSAARSGDRQFVQEFYPDRSVFVTWFDDGSGHVLYPSGEPAVLITQESKGRRFVVMPDDPCVARTTSSNCVLAMFDPRGIGFVYSEKGSLRLLFDQREGWYHREDGTIRRWRWADLDDHVHHAPTLQPIIFAVSRHVAIRVIRQDYIMLSFWAYQRSARFNVGVSMAAPETPPPQYRLVSQAADRAELAALRDKVRCILTQMAHMADEPAAAIVQHQELLSRDRTATLRRLRPTSWVCAEPRSALLVDGTSPAMARRSAAALQQELLQRMLMTQQSGGVRRRSTMPGQLAEMA